MSNADKNSLQDWLREHAPDCGDNSCLFGGRGKGGMRTNGGCRCYKDVRPDMRRIYIERMQAALSAVPPTRRIDAEERIYADKKALEVIEGQRIRIAALEARLSATGPTKAKMQEHWNALGTGQIDADDFVCIVATEFQLDPVPAPRTESAAPLGAYRAEDRKVTVIFERDDQAAAFLAKFPNLPTPRAEGAEK